MDALCGECGAAVKPGESCRDTFHRLLLLEAEVAGGPGEVAHFFAVGSYNLQHPDTMNLTAEALAGLRASVADVLDDRATMDQIRRRTRRAWNGSQRVTRRPGDAPVAWYRGTWPTNVADIVDGGIDRYAERVASWARTVCATLDERLGPP